MKKLFMDLSRGISGDMFIAALADAGVDYKGLEKIFQQAGIMISIDVAVLKRNSISGRMAMISWENNQPLRTLKEILPIIDKMDVSFTVKQKSVQAFKRLARAEADVHGTSLDLVHFHEIGALDTLADIVGAFWGLERLGVCEVTSSPMPWFSGEVDTRHGLMPLPAPATANLMQGKEVCPGDFDWEIITPTGALIVDQLVSNFENGFRGKTKVCGTGFGSVDKGFNALRVFIYDESGDHFPEDQVWLLESNIDHLTGEELGYFFRKIMEAGALDVIFLQGIMKKNRPGGQLQVLCDDENLEVVREEFFRQTLTLGIRISRVSRNILPRKDGHVSLEGEQVKAREALFSGKAYLRPEMESLAKLAEEKKMSIVELRLNKNKS
jgi:pyridinium-3,5-bisthiocarboxylic acid mononucleotide nickel chelatase